jgi:SCP1.201-like deaminase
MTTRTAQISAVVISTVEAAGGVRDLAGTYLEFAQTQTETAYSHGWHGIGATMQQVSDHLEGFLELITSTEAAGRTAVSILGQTSEETTNTHLAAYLVAASAELNTAHEATEAAMGLLDDALTASQAVGQESLEAALNGLRDDLEFLREQTARSRSETDTEHDLVITWSHDAVDHSPADRHRLDYLPASPSTTTGGHGDPTLSGLSRAGQLSPAESARTLDDLAASDPPAWLHTAGDLLPHRERADKTHGLVFDADGKALSEDLITSSDDPTTKQDLTLGQRERRATSLLADVEPKVAARMRRGDLPPDTVLVLNNIPCKGRMSCQEYLPSILPEGSRLAVYVHDGSGTRLFRIFHGTGSRITP